MTAPNGTGIGQPEPLWEQLFEPYCPNVSAWLAACPSTVQQATRRGASWYYSEVGHQAPWAVHAWANFNSPARRDCDALGGQSCRRYNVSQFAQWRTDGVAVAAAAHRPNAQLANSTAAAWHRFNPAGHTALGVHIRGTDSSTGARAKLSPRSYEPYVASFLAAHPTGRVYVATEDRRVQAYVESTWLGRLFGKERIFLPTVARGNHRHPLDTVKHCAKCVRNVLSEALLDVLLLARCDLCVCVCVCLCVCVCVCVRERDREREREREYVCVCVHPSH